MPSGLQPGPFGLSGTDPWCGRWDSNPQAGGFEPPRYADSRHTRMVFGLLGCQVADVPEDISVGKEGVEPSRPCGHWTLIPARLPFRHIPLVRKTGVEPARSRDHRSLNPARLPITPLPHVVKYRLAPGQGFEPRPAGPEPAVLPVRRSRFGRDGGSRTPGPLVPNQVLCLLSYIPSDWMRLRWREFASWVTG